MHSDGCFSTFRPFRGHFARHGNNEKTFKGSSQDAVVGKRILFSHDIRFKPNCMEKLKERDWKKKKG